MVKKIDLVRKGTFVLRHVDSGGHFWSRDLRALPEGFGHVKESRTLDIQGDESCHKHCLHYDCKIEFGLSLQASFSTFI